MPIIDKIALLCIEHKKLLSVRTEGKDTYYIPGGKRRDWETDIETLIREIKEEVSVDIIPSSIKLYGTFEAQAHWKPEGVIVQMTCYTADFSGTLQANSEIADIARLNYSHTEKVGLVAELILEDLYAKGLVE